MAPDAKPYPQFAVKLSDGEIVEVNAPDEKAATEHCLTVENNRAIDVVNLNVELKAKGKPLLPDYKKRLVKTVTLSRP